MKLGPWLYCLLLCYCGTLRSMEIRGHVRVLTGASNSNSTVIVYAEGVGTQVAPKPGRYEMVQRNKTFAPHVLAVPVGSTVTFPNADPIFHNVFSLSPPAPFDLGLYRAGSAKNLQFNTPTIYRVFCNIHPQMTGLLLVLATPYFTQVNAAGEYGIDLPPGSYRLTAWSEHSQPVTSTIVVETKGLKVAEISLDESKYVEASHKNKFGADYPRSAYTSVK